MTSPLVSFISFTNDPDRATKLCKHFAKQEFPISWELILGGNIENAVGKQWLRIKQEIQQHSNMRFIGLKKPGQPVGTYLSLLVEEAQGYFFCFVTDQDLPNKQFVAISDSIPREEIVHLGHIESPGRDLIKLKLDDPIKSFYSVETYPRGIVLFPRGGYFRLGGINKKINSGIVYELVCRFFISEWPLEIHGEPFTWREFPDGLEQSEMQDLAQISGHYFYPIIQKGVQARNLSLGDVLLHKSEPLEHHDKIIFHENKLCDENLYPVPDKKFGVLRISDVLNYLDSNEVTIFMEEVWRVLASDGWALITVPSTNGHGGFSDFRSKSFWNKRSFGLFCLDDSNKRKKIFNGLFEHTRVWESFPTASHKELDYLYVYADLKCLK